MLRMSRARLAGPRPRVKSRRQPEVRGFLNASELLERQRDRRLTELSLTFLNHGKSMGEID